MADKRTTIIEKGKRIVRYFSDRRISVNAASACFFMVLAFFPLLVLLLGIIRYAGYSAEALTELLEGVIPAALLPGAKKLIYNTYHATSGTVLSLSALTALWSAGRGIHGVINGLNSVYGVEENRSYLRTRAMSVIYTFAFLIVLLLTLVLHVFGKGVFRWLSTLDIPLFSLVGWVIQQRFFLLLLLQSLLFTAMYMFLPNRKNKFMESLPGALLSAIGWQVVSLVFSVYVENFNAYANIYGSVYAVALCLLWLYLCVCIVFYGAALNCWLKES